METHLSKQDCRLLREETWFEEDITNSRRNSFGPETPVCKGPLHNTSLSPIISRHLGDIISYLDCPVIKEINEELSTAVWQYEGVEETDQIEFANYQEEIVGLWYRWISCMYRYHTGVHRTATQLELLDTDRYLAPQTGHFCKEEYIQGTEVQHNIRTVEAGLRAIAYTSLLEHTSDVHTQISLEHKVRSVQQRYQVCVEDLFNKFYHKHKKRFLVGLTVYSRDWRDSPAALSELEYVECRIVLLSRDL